jgi:hypothetical protein
MLQKEALREKYTIVNYKKQNEGFNFSKELSDAYTFMDSNIKKEF